MKTIILFLLATATCKTLRADSNAPAASISNSFTTIEGAARISDNIEPALDPELIHLSQPPLITPDWNSLGPGIEASVETMILHNGDLYVGGCFDGIGNVPDASYVARWDGCEWYAVAPGLDGCVYALVFNGDDLYLGGEFSGYVAKWNGSTLSILPGINDVVFALGANSNGVYAGGYFTNAGGQADADGIARWNGNTWNAMGSGIIVTDVYLDIATNGNNVYVGGAFTNAGGIAAADYIARWDGSNWNSLGNGLNSYVTTVRTAGTNIYVCGDFTDAGGNTDADKIARWNGAAWANVGASNGSYSVLLSMCVTPSYIYVCRTAMDCYDVEMLRYDFQNDSWITYPDYPYWTQCATDFNTIIEIGSDLYCSWGDGLGGVVRWGEPGPYIEITGVPSYICQDAAPIPLPTTQSGYIGTWSGLGVTNNVFNPVGQNFYVTLVFTPNSGQCVSPAYFDIEVYLQVPVLTVPSTICGNSPPISLAQYQGGVNGNWSGQGVTNNIFDPAGLSGNISLTFMPNVGQCYGVGYDNIQVQMVVIPNIVGVPSSICEPSDPISLPTVENGIPGSWSGSGVTNNIFDPSGLNGQVTLTFTPNPGICAVANTTNIQVNPEIVIFINGVPDTLCQISLPVLLPVTQSGVTGNWSGPGVSNNYFNSVNQNGNTIITFNPNSGQCANATTTSIWVYLDVPVISGIPNSICESLPPFSLPTTQSGINGNWAGPGVSNNTFNPSGLYGNILLTFTPTPGQCASIAVQNIQVDSLFIPIISGLPFSTCSLADPIPLPEIQSGITGNWAGPGVSNNLFDPTELSGDILLDFIPGPGQCATIASDYITVQNASMPEITDVPLWMCVLAPPISLPVIQQGISGDWSGPGVSNNTFNPSGVNGSMLLVFTPDAGQCALVASMVLTVYTSFVPEISGVPSSICEIGLPQNLPTSQNGVLGNWSGPGVTNNVFNPSGQSDTVELIFTPLPLQCATNASWNLVIDTPSVPQIIDVPTALCESDNHVVLATIQNGIQGEWSGTGIINDTFNPAGLNGVLELTFSPNPGQCGLPSTTDIRVNGHVYPVLAELPDSICQNDHAIELAAVQDSIPGVWYGAGIENNIFNPDSLSGIQTLSFIANNGACEDTTTTRIFINTLPAITNLQVTCDSIENTYEVSFDIVGGDPASYTIDGVLIGGTSFTSSSILFTQANYSFILNDAVGCGPVPVTGFNTCLCSTYAGTMNFIGSPLRICLGPKFTVTDNGDAHLDPDDVLGYVLHDQGGNQLGQVFTLNNVPVFSYVPGMILGQTYFISAVAGTSKGKGIIDLSDPCLSVSPGVPVIFYACDPKEDDKNAGIADHHGRLDPIPFEDGIEKRYADSGQQGNYSNEKLNLFSNDPDAVIKTLRVYDLLGRLLQTQQNISLTEYIISPERFHHDLVSGYYLEVLEVENGDGEVVYVSSRISELRQ